MAIPFAQVLDMNLLEIRNLLAEILVSDPSVTEGRVFYHSGTKTLRFGSNSAYIVLGSLDQITAPAADVSMNSHKLTNLTNGSSAQDAATYGQVQAAIAGMSWKQAVRVATTAALTLASDFENGDTVDGVTLATGDRILIKDQAAPAANGIYVVAASGAPTRATDADSGAELVNAAVFVSEGTVNADSAWTVTTNATITVGSTSIAWTQFNGVAALVAGAGLTKTGSTVDAVAASSTSTGGPGGGLVVNANDIALDTAVAVVKYAADIGDGSTTSIVVTHNLGTRDVVVEVYDKTTPYQRIMCDVRHTSTTTVTLVFAVAPTSAQYRAVVHA